MKEIGIESPLLTPVERKQEEFLTPFGDRKSLVPVEFLQTVEDGTNMYKGAKAQQIAQIFRKRDQGDLANRVEIGLAFVQAIAQIGGKALFVGGSVRDQIMGRLPKDVDIEVYGVTADQVEEVARGFGRVDEVGKNFGILKITKDGSEIDVSLPRTDSKIGVGHRGFAVQVDPHMNVKEAVKRRDFSWNALVQDPLTGEIFDSHHGVEDARNRVLRVTDKERFRDDPLRILRGAQFVARFGLTVEPQTEQLIREMIPELKELAKERIFEEWKKLLLKSKRPSLGLQTLMHWGVIQELYPEIVDAMRVREEKDEESAWVNTLMRTDMAKQIAERERLDEKSEVCLLFASFCRDFHFDNFDKRASKRHGQSHIPMEQFLDKLGVPNHLYDIVIRLVEHQNEPAQLYQNFLLNPSSPKNDGDIRRLAQKIHPATVDLTAFAAEAADMGRGPFVNLEDDPQQFLLYFGTGAERWLRNSAARLGVLDKKSGPIVTGKELLAMNIGLDTLKGAGKTVIGDIMCAADTLRDDFGMKNVEILQRIKKLASEGVAIKDLPTYMIRSVSNA